MATKESAAAPHAATYDQAMNASPTRKPVNPQGMARLRVLMLTASKPIVRSTASRPSVITAIEKSGSPIILRITLRSSTSPSRAVSSAARITAENHVTYWLSPSHRPGISQSMRSSDANHAPISAMAPWAKFTVCVALKMSTKPRATMAYSEPWARPLASVWMNRSAADSDVA